VAPSPAVQGTEFRVQGSGSRVQSSGFTARQAAPERTGDAVMPSPSEPPWGVHTGVTPIRNSAPLEPKSRTSGDAISCGVEGVEQISASERRGNNVKPLQSIRLKAKAKVWL